MFDVDPRTGVIRNRVTLTGYVGDHEMVVQAADHGSPSLTNTAHVTITVLSSSQRPPDWIIPARDDFIKYIREVHHHQCTAGVFYSRGDPTVLTPPPTFCGVGPL